MSHLFLFQLIALFLPTGAAPRTAPLSDRIGVYALIDRVIIEGDPANPTAVQVWGVFSLANGSYAGHTPAQRGYMYYTANSTNDRATRAEWADLKTVAGTGEAVGFGALSINNGRVRAAGDPVASPDIYPLGIGVTRFPSALVQPQQIADRVVHELNGIPAPVTPAEGALLAPGAAVQLVARNAALKNVQYVFEITGSNGEKEASAPLPAGVNQTTWSPRLRLSAGTTYTWTVRTVDGAWKSQPANASFRAAQRG